MRRVIATGAFLACAAIGQNAYSTPSARLVYSRARGAESCPDEDALRRAIATRVGYDPFVAWAKQTIVASMAPGFSRGFAVSVHLIDDHGMEHGTRTLGTDGDCDELLDAAALAIAIAIDPRSLAPRPTAPEAPPTPPPPPPTEPPRPSTRTRLAEPKFGVADTPARPLTVEGSAGAVASVGVAPLPAAGLALGAAVRSGRVSFGVEGRVDAPASIAAVGGGSVMTWLVVATLLPCGYAGPLFACGLGQVGSVQARGNGVADRHPQSVPWLAAGGRFGVLIPVGGRTDLRMRTDVLGNLSPATLQLNGKSQWAPRLAAASFGTDVVVHF